MESSLKSGVHRSEGVSGSSIRTGRRRRRLGSSMLAAMVLGVIGSSPAKAVDLTFFFTADTHYGQTASQDNEAGNKLTIDRMNSLPGTAYPASIGGVVGTPMGVLVAGDLTDAGNYWDFNGLHYPPLPALDGFVDDYGLNGEKRLHFPVFEGYGNHDVAGGRTYVQDGMIARNELRSTPIHTSADGLHYSWDWQGVHFVNLNIFPGGQGTGDADSRDSLQFLVDDLSTNVGASDRPVIVYHHYGFDSFSDGWWTDAQRDAYENALAGYNVVGIFHGHLHTTMKYQWAGYDVFDGSAAKDGNFLVVHLTDDRMTVAARMDDQWGFTFSKAIEVPEVGPLSLLCLAVVAGMLARRVGSRRVAGSAGV